VVVAEAGRAWENRLAYFTEHLVHTGGGDDAKQVCHLRRFVFKIVDGTAKGYVYIRALARCIGLCFGAHYYLTIQHVE
jgi:hypothetical protein